ncbi:hypothetical protein Pyn_40103 [Prunus yedoensis var. nudiflora]|uniref:Secreted protein n=1 Tax=Prunus yedoensis var. nudiflora TaxID=2094558 RepID=A0A314YXP1_PRUYE|nr:hypothetical protein Pyn_40103 [Prunus yedoensis var. nudiflora]
MRKRRRPHLLSSPLRATLPHLFSFCLILIPSTGTPPSVTTSTRQHQQRHILSSIPLSYQFKVGNALEIM